MLLFLQGDKSGNSIRQHPNPFDEQYTHGKLPLLTSLSCNHGNDPTLTKPMGTPC